jgi:hypothetical protein
MQAKRDFEPAPYSIRGRHDGLDDAFYYYDTVSGGLKARRLTSHYNKTKEAENDQGRKD